MNIRTIPSISLKGTSQALKALVANPIILWSVRLTLLCILTSVIMLAVYWKSLPPQVPLWYSKPWGDDRLVHPSWLLLLPGASLSWFVLNLFLSIRITKDHLVFSQILALSSLLVSFFSLVTMGMIIWIIR